MSWQEKKNTRSICIDIFASAAAHFSFNVRFVNISKEMAISTLNSLRAELGFISISSRTTQHNYCSIKWFNAFFDKMNFDFAFAARYSHIMKP